MVFLGSLLPLLLIGAAFAACLSWGLIALGRRGTPARGCDISLMAGLAILLAAALARMCLMFVLTRRGFDILCADESCRLAIAWTWKNAPYAFSSDGVWLTGNFCYYGLLMKLLGDTALALQVGVVLGHLLTVAGAYFLAWTLSGRHWIGAVGAWLVAFMFTFLWIGAGPLVEGLMTASFMIGLALAWRTLQTPKTQPLRQWSLAAGAGFFFFAVTTLHYAGWMALSVMLPLLAGAAWQRRGDPARRILGPGALIVAGSALFPLLWCAWSWRVLGSPLAFLANQAALNNAYHIHTLWGMTSPVGAYLRCFLAQAGMLLPLAITALAWRGDGWGARRWLLLFIPLLLGLMTLSAIRGGISAGVFRNSAIPTTSMTILAALSLQPLEGLFAPGRLRWPLRPLLGGMALLLLLAWMVFNMAMGNRYETTAFGHPFYTSSALGAWLRLEVRKPESLAGLGPQTRIGFYCAENCIEMRDYVAYQAGCPERLVALTPEQMQKGELKEFDYMISERPVTAVGWRPMMQITPYTIYLREKQ